jgi:hypothetical protein
MGIPSLALRAGVLGNLVVRGLLQLHQRAKRPMSRNRHGVAVEKIP